MKAIFWVICFLTVMAIMLLIGTLMSVEWYMDRGEEVPLSIYAWQAAVAAVEDETCEACDLAPFRAGGRYTAMVLVLAIKY